MARKKSKEKWVEMSVEEYRKLPLKSRTINAFKLQAPLLITGVIMLLIWFFKVKG